MVSKKHDTKGPHWAVWYHSQEINISDNLVPPPILLKNFRLHSGHIYSFG